MAHQLACILFHPVTMFHMSRFLLTYVERSAHICHDCANVTFDISYPQRNDTSPFTTTKSKLSTKTVATVITEKKRAQPRGFSHKFTLQKNNQITTFITGSGEKEPLQNEQLLVRLE